MTSQAAAFYTHPNVLQTPFGYDPAGNRRVRQSTLGQKPSVTRSHNATDQLEERKVSVLLSVSNPVRDPFKNHELTIIGLALIPDRAGSGTYLTNTHIYTNTADSTHYLAGIIDARGTNVLRTSYNTSGQINRTLDAGGYTNHIVYDLNNWRQITTNTLGQSTCYVLI